MGLLFCAWHTIVRLTREKMQHSYANPGVSFALMRVPTVLHLPYNPVIPTSGIVTTDSVSNIRRSSRMFYGHLHTIFHILDCNNSMPIAIKCEDNNYNTLAAAIHNFYSLQQITSRKLHTVFWRLLTKTDSLQGWSSTIYTVWNCNVQDLTESGRTVLQWFFYTLVTCC
jgi:hypothetical protein